MANKYFNGYKGINKKYESNHGIYIFLLYLSFVWMSFFTATSSVVENITLGYGKLFSPASGNLFYEVFYVLLQAGVELLALEILFWIYRWFLSHKVYTFVVPEDKLKIDFRVHFIVRNIIFGVILNLCFLYPFLYSYIDFFNICTSIIVIIAFAYKIQKTYSEPIIAHFVFKNFSLPIIVYEVIIALSYFWGYM